MCERSSSINLSLKKLTTTLLVWFLLALGCSLLGVFDSQQRPPIALGFAAILPVIAFAIWRLRSPASRQFVLGANLRLLTLAQTWRVGGIVFVILYQRGVL